MQCQVQFPSAAGIQHTGHTGCMHLFPSPTSQSMVGESQKHADEGCALCRAEAAKPRPVTILQLFWGAKVTHFDALDASIAVHPTQTAAR